MLSDENYLYLNHNEIWLSQMRDVKSVTYSSTFTELRDIVYSQVKEMLDEVIKSPKNDDEFFIKQTYDKFHDPEIRGTDASAFFAKHFIRFQSAYSNTQHVSYLLGCCTRYGTETLFRIRVVPWEEDTRISCLRFECADLIMPGEQYYNSCDSFYTETRAAYFEILNEILTAIGISDPETPAHEIFLLEQNLVNNKLSTEEERNPRFTCNTVSHSVFEDLTALDLACLCNGLKASLPQNIVLESLGYSHAVKNILLSTSIKTLETYAKVRFYLKYRFFFSNINNCVIDDFVQNIVGTERKYPEELICSYQHLITSFDDYLSELYTQRYSTPQTLKFVEEMVKEIIITFTHGIQESTWMSDTFKSRALRKISAIKIKIGTPPVLTAYHRFLKFSTPLETVLAIKEEKFRHYSDCLNGPFNPHLWDMYGYEVNACYNRRKNEIILPSAVLQSPLLMSNLGIKYNYGSIGIIIAHEISHALDDEGCYFDENGNLNMLWTQQDEANFIQKANVIADFYSNIEVLPGNYINGLLTRGECLADLSGCDIAWKTLQRLSQEETSELREAFQTSLLMLWREYASENIMRKLLTSGPHAPARFRAIGCLHYLARRYSGDESVNQGIQA
ncbi:TPA: M13 family metallopeptidase, partial [Klebsiella aerogenes]|nr:M13 family metallopeptidase [Klebsiella aerogenes]